MSRPFFFFKPGSGAATILLAILLTAGPAWSLDKPEADWGGYFKVRGMLSLPTAGSLLGDDPLLDGSLETRITNELRFGSRAWLDTHYELVGGGGGTIRRESELGPLLPAGLPAGFLFGRLPEDDLRFFDLTGVLYEGEEMVVYQRLDRLVLTLTPKWGTLRLGRQAVTLGNGLLFNPMDLFNPFAPTDIEREYKLGDDMVTFQRPVFKNDNLLLLYVPRRDPETGNVAWDQSSLAGRLHWAPGVTEFDLLLAGYYGDAVFGLGSVGYLGGAAWRLDATWTLMDEESGEDYLSLVANLDYAWVWGERNYYGFVEFFYSGIGLHAGDYSEVFTDETLLVRLERGDLFTLGRFYLAGQLRVEVHPLVSIALTVINNLQDPSGVLQPRLIWDVSQNTQILLGGSLVYGGQGTEFGGFAVPGTPFNTRPADSVFLWWSWYF